MRGPRDSGFALLIVLWALALVSLLVAQLAASGRSEASMAGNMRAAAELQARADGAINAAIFELLRPGPSAWATTGEHVVGGVAVRTRDQAGLVNPNTAPPELLRALLRRAGLDAPHAESLADAIADWRSPGRAPRPHGAKAEAYRAAGLGYGPPGAPFESVAELRDVLGVTPALFAAMAPHLTVLWEGDPDPTLADPVVLLALLDTGQARTDVAARPETRVVTIVARASGGGAAVARHAAIRLGYSPDGRGWRVLAWDSGEE